jgi:hypothetical protein
MKRIAAYALALVALGGAGLFQRNRSSELCQNCVTYPPKPWVNTTIYGDTRMHIVVVVDRECVGGI